MIFTLICRMIPKSSCIRRIPAPELFPDYGLDSILLLESYYNIILSKFNKFILKFSFVYAMMWL